MSADPNAATQESTPAGAPAAATAEPSADEKTWGMLAHLSALVTGFLGPLVIWLIKKDEMPFVEEQGKEALNFQITMAIGFAVCFVLAFVLIGAFLMPVLWLINLVMCILAGVKVQKGEHYRYPFTLRLIK